MKIVLDVRNTPTENDILIFKNGMWECVNKEKVLNSFRQEIALIKQDVINMKNENETLKKAVNEKLKSYHNILQQMTKED